jgi:tryptophan synthase alpha chain
MEEIERVFNRLKDKGEKAFIPYIMAGYPDPLIFTDILRVMTFYGDLVELGVPFSDPIADGPIIEEAGHISLSMGMNIPKILGLVEDLRGNISCPVLLMSYFNPIYRYGLIRFARDIKMAGISGLIIPDLPPEEAGQWIDVAGKYEIATIFLLAPTSTSKRIRMIGRASKGFIYLVSKTGITGGSLGRLKDIGENVRKIKELTSLPVVVGFGVSTPDEAGKVASLSDGVVVGSALIRTIKNVMKKGDVLEEVSKFLESMKKGVKASS